MACFMNVMVVFIFSIASASGESGAEVKANDNAEQFALLCRIYNVAKNPPINHADLQDPLKIVNEIYAINASLAEERQLNETGQVGNILDAHVKPTITLEAAVAQAILRRITKRAHTILESIRKVNITSEIGNAKLEFAQVILGEGKNESHLCDGVLKDVGERGNACGKPGAGEKGTHAGKNLVVDFFCLCAQRTEDGIDNACKVKVGSKSEKHSWGTLAPSGSPSMWASIKKECANLLHQTPKSTKEGHEVLEDFLKHLKAGGVYSWGDTSVKGHNLKPGMLGTAVGKENGGGNDLLCDGSKGYTGKGGKKGKSGTPPGGMCVYYGAEPEWQNIPWLKPFKTALASVDSVNNQTAAIKRNIKKLQMLLHRAEEIYETAKVITEIKYPIVPTAFQNASGNLTAYNATRTRSYSYTYHTYFIPMWVLFFL
ncbi:Variant surface glycoprotein [Trypanosoma congolense IL3000]|uniref:Variant surface glycoprotein n=1 Tax=Trypanosoma congolense (strain IL3000) TaxID=1068625 RepID=F9W3K9_TRYCI|nr:Variant surface glycoprotein [Trypanosoma congolense IL3000]